MPETTRLLYGPFTLTAGNFSDLIASITIFQVRLAGCATLFS